MKTPLKAGLWLAIFALGNISLNTAAETINANAIFDALTIENDGIDSRKVNLDIQFELGSATLTQTATEQLNQLGKALEQIGSSTFEIAGHTDSSGSLATNQTLSQARADSVLRFLLANFDLNPDELVAQGYGEILPLAAHSPSDARNRRVEIINHGQWLSVEEVKAMALEKLDLKSPSNKDSTAEDPQNNTDVNDYFN